MNGILIKEASIIVTSDKDNRILENEDIYISDSKIVNIGRNLDIKHKIEKVIYANGLIVLPGFINTHHHLYQTLSRCIPEVQNMELFDWLRFLYQVWKKINPEALYYSTLVGCAELILSGCTTTSDMFYIFPQNQPSDLIDYEIQAAKETGIRFHLCRGAMSRGKSKGGLPPDEITQSEDEILKDYERLLKKYHDQNEGSMLRISLAPCSPFSVSKELLQLTIEFARKNNLLSHTHISETKDEVDYCLQNYNKRPIEMLHELSWLGSDVWLAHCIHLSNNEIELLGSSGTGVSHCPSSNMKLGAGISPVKKLLKSGCKVSLAVDGSASNDSSSFLPELKQALLLSRLLDRQNWLSVMDVLLMATSGGAKVLNRNDIGSIEIGKSADLACFKIDEIQYAGASDLVSAFVICGLNRPAKYVIINGKIVVEDYNIKTIDIEKVKYQANKLKLQK